MMTIDPGSARRAVWATISRARGDSAELLGRKKTAATGNNAWLSGSSCSTVAGCAIGTRDGGAASNQALRRTVVVGSSSMAVRPAFAADQSVALPVLRYALNGRVDPLK